MKKNRLLILLLAFGFPASFWANSTNDHNSYNLVSAAPVSSFSVATATICVGSPVVLMDNSSNNPTSWNWQMPGAITSSASVNNPTVVYNNPGSYTISLTASNASGTGNTFTLAIFVNPNPTVSVSASTTQVCSGKSATLSAQGAASYTWLTSSSSTIITTNTYAITPPLSNTYTVVGTSSLGCSANVTVAVAVLPLPTITATASKTIMCKGDCSTITASGANAYTWSTGESGSSIVYSPTLISTFVVTVTGTSSLGCLGNTYSLTIKVMACFSGSPEARLLGPPCVIIGGVGEQNSLAQLSIMPNPGNGTYSLSNLPEAELISLQVFDELGRELFHKQGTAQELNVIHLNYLSNGMYLLRIRINMQTRQLRLLKE
ncbi:MAG: T9SS type A sorting domain-containing protein [Bacteroidia bacterium]|nr:T9SS type A sorting domain-containing protein [Bacteroidia bacterium]